MKKLLNYDFEYVQDLNPVLDSSGEIEEFSPQENYKKKNQLELNKYGEGSFCRFSVHAKWSGVSGVYAFFIDDTLAYIGQALDLAQRFNTGYGIISPRNCYVGGQSTNCKINKLVLNSVKCGRKVSVYFHMTHNFNEIERELIIHLKPQHNTALKYDSTIGKRSIARNQMATSKLAEVIATPKTLKNPSISEVKRFIEEEIKIAKEKGNREIIIQSGMVHKRLNMINEMPTVCSAMRTLNGGYRYEVIEEPPKGNGSRLIFKYII